VLNPDYTLRYLIDPIELAWNKNEFKKVNDTIWKYAYSKSSNIYLIKQNSEFVGAVLMSFESYYDIECIVPKITKKFRQKYFNIMNELYKQASKDYSNISVISDKEQTQNSKKVWLKWLNNPNKYGINKIDVYYKGSIVDTKDPKVIWGGNIDYQNWRLVLKYN